MSIVATDSSDVSDIAVEQDTSTKKVQPKPAETKPTLTLRQAFLEVNRQSIPYVVINYSSRMPENVVEHQIRILLNSDDLDRFTKAADLSYVSGESYKFPDGTAFRLIQKGAGYFPEQFETLLLKNYRVANDCIKAPAMEHEMWIVLYEFVYHQVDINDVRQMRILNETLRRKLGKALYKPNQNHYDKYK